MVTFYMYYHKWQTPGRHSSTSIQHITNCIICTSLAICELPLLVFCLSVIHQSWFVHCLSICDIVVDDIIRLWAKVTHLARTYKLTQNNYLYISTIDWLLPTPPYWLCTYCSYNYVSVYLYNNFPSSLESHSTHLLSSNRDYSSW